MFNSDYPLTQAYPVCLSQEEWLQPKTVIEQLFDSCSLPELVQDTKLWIKYAFQQKALSGKKIVHAHEVHKDLLRLLEVGTLLKDDENSHLPKKADWMDPRWWLGEPMGDFDPFDYFPRHLRRDEYDNPYRVFYKCQKKYSLIDWRLRLEDLWLHGCSKVHLYEFQDHPSVASDYQPLPKLLEAAHLIYVRELSKKTGV